MTKRTDRKLSLNRETLRTITSNDLAFVVGGTKSGFDSAKCGGTRTARCEQTRRCDPKPTGRCL